MKKLATTMVVLGALATWAPTVGASDFRADNSGRNARDRQTPPALTAADQSNDPADVAITRAIRQAIMADENLSTNAHNVKIITVNGVVTLRGPVKSAAEKAAIGEVAKKAAGPARVDNQLEIASQ